MKAMRILVVEDDHDTGRFLARSLGAIGHRVEVSTNGQDGLTRASNDQFDAIIVDRMLPALDGLSIIKTLRAAGDDTPTLVLSAVAGIADRVEGLEGGADDYLVKPFAVSELAARIHALGRRPTARTTGNVLRVNRIEIDLHRRSVERERRRVILQPREFALLAELMRNAGRVMTKAMLLERVWDYDFDPKTNIVETHMSRLRSKLNAGYEGDAIETVRGAGYMIREG